MFSSSWLGPDPAAKCFLVLALWREGEEEAEEAEAAVGAAFV